ncbi:hypothetical protein AYI68_g2002 [Smittium mucronatum]|uniref:TPR repeat-containing protein n=1 Tax=Smittium mucronatum TaxID=133383 RepID=A0A1R0GN57_9FUNG|nr:hypothetical protein AYI68_g7625 [Smittium mucronatum]OLY83848.1 hypothetical protein AYI68_g2002 [Smittium mucronatum]
MYRITPIVSRSKFPHSSTYRIIPKNISTPQLQTRFIFSKNSPASFNNLFKSKKNFQTRKYVLDRFNDPLIAEKIQFYKPLLNFIVIVCALSIIGITSYAYGSHWYIENCIFNTSQDLDDETRRLVRAAMFRKIVNPDPKISKIYLTRALENLTALNLLDYANPNIIDIYFLLADANISLGDYAEAIEALELVRLGLNLNDPVLNASRTSSTSQSSQGSPSEKVSDSGKVSEIWYTKARLMYNLSMGQINLANGNYQEATDNFSDSLVVIPNLLNLINDNQTLTSEEITNKYYEVKLLQANLTTSLAEIYTIDKKYEQAEILFNGALAIVNQHKLDVIQSPPNPDYELSATVERLKKSDPISCWFAEKLLARKKSQRDSSPPIDEWTCLDAVILVQMAQLYRNSNNIDQLRSHASKAVNIATSNPNVSSCDECAFHAYRILGKLENSLGNPENAINYLQQALQLSKRLKLAALDEVASEVRALYEENPISSSLKS